MRAKIISLILTLFSRLSLSKAQGIGRLLGWAFYRLPNKEREIARINIASCLPELDAQARDRLLRNALTENAKTLTEMPGIWSGRYSKWSERIELGRGKELYQQAQGESKGMIFIGPHQGNWEMGLQYLSTLGKVTSPYRAPKMSFLDERIKQGRGQGGATLVEATPGGVKALYGALKRGEIVAMLSDQQPKAAGKQGAAFAPFFGHPALTGVLACRLAQKTGVPVLFWFMERLPNAGGFRMNWFAAPEGIYDQDISISAAALNLGLETCISACPEQYLWTYKRFDRQPDGIQSPYKINTPLTRSSA